MPGSLGGNPIEFWQFLNFHLPTLAYVTYQDIRAISNFNEQTVIVVRAPPETRLEVPDICEVSIAA